MRSKVNVITLIILLLIIVGWYINDVSLYYLIPVAIIYLVVNIIGSANIQMGYFIESHCNSVTEKREIALSFDDGPHPDITHKLLELLNKYDVRGTFFCTGNNVSKYPEIVSEIISNGHVVGNHSYGHSQFFDLFSAGNMKDEILNTNRVIKSISGKTPLLFRPPYGVTNPMLRKAVKRSQMTSIGWSLRSFDTVNNSEKVLFRLKNRTKPGDIVLFHDTNPNIITVIDDYISWLAVNNYKIVSLTDLLSIEAYDE